jgi:RNA polymerase sigma factor (sigma-70 family)
VDSLVGRTEIERLYREYGASLVLFAVAYTADRGRAQDAVHQVFLRLMERGDLSRAADVKAYLFASVRNALLNDRKTRARIVALEPDVAWFEPPNRDFAAERNLKRELLSLSDELRDVTTMHIWGELTFAQIGEILGISANTAASRYRYALARLREVMCPEEDSCARRG